MFYCLYKRRTKSRKCRLTQTHIHILYKQSDYDLTIRQCYDIHIVRQKTKAITLCIHNSSQEHTQTHTAFWQNLNLYSNNDEQRPGKANQIITMNQKYHAALWMGIKTYPIWVVPWYIYMCVFVCDYVRLPEPLCVCVPLWAWPSVCEPQHSLVFYFDSRLVRRQC